MISIWDAIEPEQSLNSQSSYHKKGVWLRTPLLFYLTFACCSEKEGSLQNTSSPFINTLSYIKCHKLLERAIKIWKNVRGHRKHRHGQESESWRPRGRISCDTSAAPCWIGTTGAHNTLWARSYIPPAMGLQAYCNKSAHENKKIEYKILQNGFLI